MELNAMHVRHATILVPYRASEQWFSILFLNDAVLP